MTRSVVEPAFSAGKPKKLLDLRSGNALCTVSFAILMDIGEVRPAGWFCLHARTASRNEGNCGPTTVCPCTSQGKILWQEQQLHGTSLRQISLRATAQYRYRDLALYSLSRPSLGQSSVYEWWDVCNKGRDDDETVFLEISFNGPLNETFMRESVS
jgi:hypothetical protein